MRKITSWYNRNRRIILGGAIAIIIAFFIIRVTNSLLMRGNNEENDLSSNEIGKDLNTLIIDDNKTILTQEYIGKEQDELLKVIDQFVDSNNQHRIEEAYQFLSEDCKKQLYPTVEDYQKNYYDKIFSKFPKRVVGESWTENTYRIKYMEDALATGIYEEEPLVQDYITVVKEGDNVKLNINQYIGKTQLNKENADNNVKINVKEKDTYMNYEVYLFEITNTSENKILLNDLNNDQTMYLKDSNNIQYYAYMHEMEEAELILNPGETKQIAIKYYNQYSATKTIKSIIFSQIVLNYNMYANTQNLGYYQDYGMIEIDL